MADADKPRPPPPKANKSEKVFFELPGVFKMGLVNEEQPPPQPHLTKHASSGVIIAGGLVALAILCAMFVALGRRRRRAGGNLRFP